MTIFARRGMKMDWNESSMLKLIAAVRKVEDNWGAQNWEDPGEKWRHIAAELPELQSYLELDTQEFPDVCKTGFAKICRYFNESITTKIKPSSLTSKIMTALASYSLTLNHDERLPSIGSKKNLRPIVLADINEESSEESDMDCSKSVSIEFEEDKHNHDSKTSQDLMATSTTSNLEETRVVLVSEPKLKVFIYWEKGVWC